MLCDPDESDVGTDGGLIPDAGTAQDTWCRYPEGGKRYDWFLGGTGRSSKLTPFSPEAFGLNFPESPAKEFAAEPALLRPLPYSLLCFIKCTNSASVLMGVSFSNN